MDGHFDVARAHLVGGVQRLVNRTRLGLVWSMIRFQSEPPRSTDHLPYHQPLPWGGELGAPNFPGRVSVSQLDYPLGIYLERIVKANAPK